MSKGNRERSLFLWHDSSHSGENLRRYYHSKYLQKLCSLLRVVLPGEKHDGLLPSGCYLFWLGPLTLGLTPLLPGAAFKNALVALTRLLAWRLVTRRHGANQ
jgi:hypothetical protein